MKIQPGTFYSNGIEYMAVSVVSKRTTLTASEVVDAIAAGLVKVRVFSGCKAVSKADVGMLVRMKGGRAMSLVIQQQEAVKRLYHLLTDGNMIFTNDDSDIKAMARFCDLFDWCASSPMELDEVNRRWLPTYNAAKHVVELMEQDRISVVEIWGGRRYEH